jgi:hypothetical protein
LLFIVLIFNLCFAQEQTRVIFDGEYVIKGLHMKSVRTSRIGINNSIVYQSDYSTLTVTPDFNGTKQLINKIQEAILATNKEEIKKRSKSILCSDAKFRTAFSKYHIVMQITDTMNVFGKEIIYKYKLNNCN